MGYLRAVDNTRALNFGLTEQEFTDLTERLADGDEQFFEHVFLAHFEDCMSFLVRTDGAAADLAYDATMEAFYAFRTKVAQGKITYGNLRFLLTRMARQFYVKALRREPSDATIPEFAEEDDATFSDETFRLLRAAWRRLGEKCRVLLDAYYRKDQSLREIAEATAQNYAALRKRKQRCMEKLKGWVAE